MKSCSTYLPISGITNASAVQSDFVHVRWIGDVQFTKHSLNAFAMATASDIWWPSTSIKEGFDMEQAWWVQHVWVQLSIVYQPIRIESRWNVKLHFLRHVNWEIAFSLLWNVTSPPHFYHVRLVTTSTTLTYREQMSYTCERDLNISEWRPTSSSRICGPHIETFLFQSC